MNVHIDTEWTFELPEREEADMPFRGNVELSVSGRRHEVDGDPEVQVDGQWMSLYEIGLSKSSVDRAEQYLVEEAVTRSFDDE